MELRETKKWLRTQDAIIEATVYLGILGGPLLGFYLTGFVLPSHWPALIRIILMFAGAAIGFIAGMASSSLVDRRIESRRRRQGLKTFAELRREWREQALETKHEHLENRKQWLASMPASVRSYTSTLLSDFEAYKQEQTTKLNLIYKMLVVLICLAIAILAMIVQLQ